MHAKWPGGSRMEALNGAVDLTFSDAPQRASPEVRARILLDCLPESVRIGPHDYRIVRKSTFENAGHFAQIDPKAQEIRLWPHSSPTNLVDSFFHECVHAIWRQAGLGGEAQEESVATTFAVSLTALHRDNPWLAGWINGAMQ